MGMPHGITSLFAGKLKLEWASMRADAAQDGYQVDVAIEAYLFQVLPDTAAVQADSSWQVRMEYAELLLNLWGVQAVTNHRQAMTAVSAASTATLLNKAQIDKLAMDVAKFEV